MTGDSNNSTKRRNSRTIKEVLTISDNESDDDQYVLNVFEDDEVL